MSVGGGKSSSNNQSQQTSTQALDPQIKQALLSNLSAAQGVAKANSTPYTGQLVAPMNGTQNAGLAAMANVANSNTGAPALNSAVGAETGLTSFTPSTVTPAQLSSTNLAPYLNPYTSDVINTTMSDLQRQNQIANVANDAQATAANAFGGDRSAVLDSLTNEAAQRTAASTLAGLNQSNFTQAQGAAQSDVAAKNAAQIANQQAGIQGAQVNQGAATGLAAMSGQQVSQATGLAQLLYQAGLIPQQQAQAVDTANQGQFQTNFNNQMTLQELINQALGLAGNPTLTQSQGTSSGSSNAFSLSGSINPAK